MASHPTADGKPPRKPNRYQLAGYPRYKNPRKHNGIPHRFASGCKLTRDERYQEGTPRHERSWKVHVIGVRGKIDARAMFPFEIVKWADADVIWHDNNYWLSVCVAGDCSREHGDHPTTIKFNLLGEFATVLPAGLTAGGARVQCAMAELAVAQALQYDHECLKSQFDTDYPRGKRRTPTQQEDYVEWDGSLPSGGADRSQASQCNAVMTTRWVEQASVLTIIAPNITENTKTPHGNQADWGEHSCMRDRRNPNA